MFTWLNSIQVNYDYTIKIEIETVQCSFLWFRPSGYRVLPLSMRCASLALRRDMVRVGCYSSGISSLASIEWPGWFKWKGTAAVAFLWSGLFVVNLWSMFTERAFSFTYLNHGKTSYTFTNTGETRQIKHHITCDSTNLTYMIQCKRCKKQYIGETERTLRERFKEHIDRHQTIHSRQTP